MRIYEMKTIRTNARLSKANERNRLKNLEVAIRRYLASDGKKAMPTLRKPLRGAESVYNRFGVRPHIDVFIPLIGMSEIVIDMKRQEFNALRAKQRREDDNAERECRVSRRVAHSTKVQHEEDGRVVETGMVDPMSLLH
jgi:hypothetical protein